ncbi:MAG: hypothetical protein GX683_04925, partial [Ruminococcaceae bacterium]|nr:hypothetical protein [Oscillospiraceae bacterium]
SKTIRDYITEYQCKAHNDQIHQMATGLGIDEEKLRKLMDLHLDEASINEFGRFDDLKSSIDINKAK